MTTKDTGGTAFPTQMRVYKAGYSTSEFEPVGGMTMRDYFAAKAIEGACNGNGGLPDIGYLTIVAERAYQMADAMIEARK